MLGKIKKKRILKFAMESGCDIDGDVVVYKGRRYVVNIRSGSVLKYDLVGSDIPFWKRWKINGRLPL